MLDPPKATAGCAPYAEGVPFARRAKQRTRAALTKNAPFERNTCVQKRRRNSAVPLFLAINSPARHSLLRENPSESTWLFSRSLGGSGRSYLPYAVSAHTNRRLSVIQRNTDFLSRHSLYLFRLCPIARLIFDGKLLRNTAYFAQLQTAEGMRFRKILVFLAFFSSTRRK